MKVKASSVSGRLLDLTVISIVAISATAIVFLIFGAFEPKITVATGMTIALLLFILKDRVGSIADTSGIGVLAIGIVIFTALVFRAHPYPWISGGQDQGVYVNMSSYYQHGGKIFFSDNVLKNISNNDLKAEYLANRSKNTQYQPGVYYGGKKDYVFQFYHLHPLWMAIFADLFGDDARVYSLTFFSLVSLVFLSLVTFELSNSKAAALAVGLLLAFNPLHAFFSKFPVTEVVALAFSATGVYYLLRACRLSDLVVQARWALLIAFLSLSMLFFVRISGFLYLPALSLVLMTGIWVRNINGNRFGTDLAVFALAGVASYVLSVFYGLKYSPIYSNDQYNDIFGKLVGGHIASVISVFVGCLLISMYLWHRLLGHRVFASTIAPWVLPRLLTIVMVLLAFIAVAISFYKVYLLGFTDQYAGDWFGTRWGLSGSGMEAVVRSSALNWFIYSSPLLAVLGVLALLRENTDLKLAVLLVLPITALSTFVITTQVLPYQYYYARYLLTEAVPYAIVIFVASTVGSYLPQWRKLGITAVALSIAFFGYFTIKQYGAEGGVRPLNVLRKIAGHLDENDVLFIDPSGWSIGTTVIQTPLIFYFGLKTSVMPVSKIHEYSSQIADSFRDIWLLSPRFMSDERLNLVDRLLYYDKRVAETGGIPLKVIKNPKPFELFFYRIKKVGWPTSDVQ